MRIVKECKLLKIKNKILINLCNEKYELKLGEFDNATGTERARFVFQTSQKIDFRK